MQVSFPIEPGALKSLSTPGSSIGRPTGSPRLPVVSASRDTAATSDGRVSVPGLDRGVRGRLSFVSGGTGRVVKLSIRLVGGSEPCDR